MAAARQPVLFVEYGVADTFEGRFEILALLATLPVRRLAQLEAPGPDLAQELTDSVFNSFDDALRALGISDVGVPKQIHKLASGWLGRRQAYAAALDAKDGGLLDAALARNVFGGAKALDEAMVQRLARYVRATAAAHDSASLDVFIKARAPFVSADTID